jgi:hypothetical protein
MLLYIVTSKSENRDSSGNLEWATANFHGVFTSEDMANAIADKYDGIVTESYLDMERSNKVVLQDWNVVWSREN